MSDLGLESKKIQTCEDIKKQRQGPETQESDLYLVFLLPGFFVMAGLMSFSVSGLSLIGCSLSLFSFSGASPSGLTLS